MDNCFTTIERFAINNLAADHDYLKSLSDVVSLDRSLLIYDIKNYSFSSLQLLLNKYFRLLILVNTNKLSEFESFFKNKNYVVESNYLLCFASVNDIKKSSLFIKNPILSTQLERLNNPTNSEIVTLQQLQLSCSLTPLPSSYYKRDDVVVYVIRSSTTIIGCATCLYINNMIESKKTYFMNTLCLSKEFRSIKINVDILYYILSDLMMDCDYFSSCVSIQNKHVIKILNSAAFKVSSDFQWMFLRIKDDV